MSKSKKLPSLLLGLAWALLPAGAQAAVSRDSVNVTFTITGQCTVKGGVVNLGTFTTSNSWADVARSVGYFLIGNNGALSGVGYTPGTRGVEYADYGTLTCAKDTPYDLNITGSGASSNMIRIQMGTQIAVFIPAIKRIGDTIVPNNGGPLYADSGHHFSIGDLSGIGTGQAQQLRGSAMINLNSGTESNLQFEPAAPKLLFGSYTDTLRYTVKF